MTIIRSLRKSLLGTALALALAGCLGSNKPLGGKGENAMTYEEVMALLGPEGGGKIKVNRPDPNSELGRYGFFETRKGKQTLAFRLFPTRGGIVVELPPGTFHNPIWLYGAILPHPEGAAMYFDQLHLSEASKGKDGPELEPARQVLPLLKKVTTPGTVMGISLFKPRAFESVIAIYQALAAAGQEPMSILPMER